MDRYIKSIFESSVQESLNAYGIYPGTSTVPSTNQKAEFLFSAVMSRVGVEWVISGKIQNDISYDPATGSYNSLALKEIIQDYVKNEILTETRNLQLDAERRILENLADAKYFKKDGVKKLAEDVMDVLSPGSKNVNKLLGTKIKSTSAENYRKTVLDVIHPDSSSGLETTISEVRKMQGTDEVPGNELKIGQKITAAFVDVIDYKVEKGQVDSPHLVGVLKIKEQYEIDTKTHRDKIKELVVNRNSTFGATGRATINAEISREETKIQDIRVGTIAGVVGAGRNYEAEISLAQRVGNNNFSINLGTSFTTTAAIGTSSPSMLGAAGITSGLPLFMTDARPVMMSVWEKNPEARVKIEELQARVAGARSSSMRTFYQDQINSLTRKLTDPTTGRSADVFGYKFNADGTLDVEDRIQELRERSIKKLAKSFAYPNISRALNEYRLVDASTKVVYLEHLLLNHPTPSIAYSEISDLIDMHNTYAQALKLASILPISGKLGAPELALINQDKAFFISNISKIVSNPTEQAKILGYLNSGDYAQFSIYFASGFGNKNAEIIRARMNARLYKLATNDTVAKNNPEFSRAVMDTALIEEAIKSQVFRRYTENVIMAAQLMTDGKYLAREIKRTLQKEVLTALGNKYIKPFLTSTFGQNTAFGDYLDNIYGVLSDPEFRKDPAKYIKENLIKGSKGFVGSFLNNKFKDFKKISFLGKEIDLDFIKIVTDPKEYFLGTLKNRLYVYFSAFVYTNLVSKIRLLRTYYVNLKIYIRKAVRWLKRGSLTLLEKFAPSLFARFGAMIAGLAIPGIGWIVTAVLAVLPILLKPFLKEGETVGDLIKKALKVILVGPCVFLFIIWSFILVPIVSLFANLGSTLFEFITVDFVDMEKGVLSGTVNSPFGVYGEYDLGYKLVENLVTTTGNKCIDGNNKSLYSFQRKNPVGWNNLKEIDFKGLQNPTELTCKIVCSARSELSTLYPGIGGLLNCSSTRNEIFNSAFPEGSASQRFWCTHTIIKSWGQTSDYAFMDNDAYTSVSYMNNKLIERSGNDIERISLFNNDPNWYAEIKGGGTKSDPASSCFDKDSLSSGAILTMAQTSNCTMNTRGNHVVMFLKFEGKNLVYMNSNSGLLKEVVPFEDCGNGKIKLKTKIYNLEDGTLQFYMCNLFQPKVGVSPSVSSCDVCPIPSINNY